MRGSCLCQAIQYEVDELAGGIQHCSCRTCRKAHAAAFNSSAAVRPARFRWIKGHALLSFFESSPVKRRYFCSKCGTHLIAMLTTTENLLVRVATLDEDPGVPADCHIWVSQEVGWLRYGPPLPAYPEWGPAGE